MVDLGRELKAAEARAEAVEETILRHRHVTGPVGWLYTAVAGTLLALVIYQIGWGRMGLLRLLPLFLGLSFLTVFYLFPAWKAWEPPPSQPPVTGWRRHAARALMALDVALALGSAWSAFYLYLYRDDIILRAATGLTETDVLVATIGIVALFEAVRRSVGLPMSILAAGFIAYAFLAHRLDPSSSFYVRPKKWDLLAEQLWFGTEGVFDVPVQVAAKYVLVFVLLGSIFKYSGVGAFFINFAYSLTGHRRGGPAKTAVLASALMGTVSGSSIANVVTTGSFTIPMMKRLGYRAEFAGAVEASASTGGQIMPPVMGAAAFVMVEYLAISYRTVVLAAIIPALCFFFGAWVMVHLEAKRRNLPSVPKAQLPRTRELLRRDWVFLLPFAMLFTLVMIPTMDILKAAVYTAIATVAVSFVRKDTRYTWRKARDTVDETARNMAGVTMACAAAGVIGGIVKLTGFGAKIVYLVSDFSGGIFFIALLLTMVACLILGMGLPTTATYILVVTLAAPVIVNFPGHAIPAGLTLVQWTLVAHMFVFFYGVVADVTPPVALAAYAASGIAGSDQFRTGWEAFKISTNKFLVPFAFVYQPAFLLLGFAGAGTAFYGKFVFDLVFLFVGVFFIHAGLSRFAYTHSRTWEAAAMFVAGVLMMFPFVWTSLTGLALAAASVWTNRARSKREDAAVLPG